MEGYQILAFGASSIDIYFEQYVNMMPDAIKQMSPVLIITIFFKVFVFELISKLGLYANVHCLQKISLRDDLILVFRFCCVKFLLEN